MSTLGVGEEDGPAHRGHHRVGLAAAGRGVGILHHEGHPVLLGRGPWSWPGDLVVDRGHRLGFFLGELALGVLAAGLELGLELGDLVFALLGVGTARSSISDRTCPAPAWPRWRSLHQAVVAGQGLGADVLVGDLELVVILENACPCRSKPIAVGLAGGRGRRGIGRRQGLDGGLTLLSPCWPKEGPTRPAMPTREESHQPESLESVGTSIPLHVRTAKGAVQESSNARRRILRTRDRPPHRSIGGLPLEPRSLARISDRILKPVGRIAASLGVRPAIFDWPAICQDRRDLVKPNRPEADGVGPGRGAKPKAADAGFLRCRMRPPPIRFSLKQ